MTNSKSTIVNSQFPRPLPLTDEELQARSPQDRKSFLDWLETEYYLSPKVHGLATRWSREYGPFWIDIIECLDDTTTREVWVYAPAQAGKSTLMTGWLGYTVDCDPVPMGLVMPRDDDASERVECNIVPMFEENPRLLSHVGGRASKINIGKMTMFDNMAFYLLFATSAAAMANKAICRIGLDEVGKYPAQVGKESDPITLARDRLETFKGRSKLFGITTPVIKGDLADINWTQGDCCQWYIKCVHCGQYHKPIWKNVVLDKKPDGSLLAAKTYSKGGRARYVCPDCGAVYTEVDRWRSVCAGRWVGDADRGPVRSFRITAFMLHPAIQTIDYLASRWSSAMLEKQRGNTRPLQGFINSRLAEVWELTESEPDEARLNPHITGSEQGVVPVGARILTAAIDVQIDHVWFAAVAWGWQFEGWLIDARRIETGSTELIENFECVKPYLAKRWDMAGDPDRVMRARMIGVDAGYRTEQIYSICRMWADLPVAPIMGWSENKITGRLYRTVKLSDGLMRYDLNADRFKDSIYRQLFIAEAPGPGFLHLYGGIPGEYLQHLISERQIRQAEGRREFLTWVLRDSHWPNHLWDLLVYNRFLAEISGVPAIQNPNRTESTPNPPGKPVGKKPIRTKY